MSMNPYEKAFWFSEDLTTQGNYLDSKIEELLLEIHTYAQICRKHPARHLPQLKILILNFLKASEYPEGLMTLPMSAGQYSEFQRMTYRVTVELLINTLLNMKWISVHTGYRFARESRLSRIRINQPLREWLEKLHVDTDDIEREPPQLTLQYKNKDKRPVPIPKHLEAKALELDAGTKTINETLRTTFIDLFIDDYELEDLNLRMSDKSEDNPYQKSRLDYSQRYLKRVFNNESFEDGGRFYGGWWQSIPSEYRKYISLNGDLTIEMDYSSIHIHLLYAELQSHCPHKDHYVFGKLTKAFRPVTKTLMMILINASSEKAALASAEKTRFI